MNLPDVLKLAACILASQAAGAFGALFTETGPGSWYAGLAKPSFTPPGWVFGPVWSTLYALMGISAWLVWKRGSLSTPPVRGALLLFAAQLALNAAWSGLFFGLKSTLLGLVGIAALAAAILATIMAFRPISSAAAWLLSPYFAWVCFASVLNFAIWRLNP